MSRLPPPTVEELEFVYDLITRGYDDASILAEYAKGYVAGTLMFPYRMDNRFVRARRKELEAAKKVVGAKTPTGREPLVSEAQRKHTEDLLELAREFRHDLVVDTGDTYMVEDSLLPGYIGYGAGELGWHQWGPLVWFVGHEAEVEVWLAVERRKEFLFTLLMEHLPSDLQDTYKAIKAQYAEAIKKFVVHPRGNVSIPGLINMIFKLAQGLEEILATLILEGSCQACRKYR